jgi:hypothetical protein
MTDVQDRVDRTLREGERDRAADEQFVRLREFLADMHRKGLVIKKEYDLPPIDTIGRTAYRNDG